VTGSFASRTGPGRSLKDCRNHCGTPPTGRSFTCSKSQSLRCRPVSRGRSVARCLPSPSSVGRPDDLVHGHGGSGRAGRHRCAVRQGRHMNGARRGLRSKDRLARQKRWRVTTSNTCSVVCWLRTTSSGRRSLNRPQRLRVRASVLGSRLPVASPRRSVAITEDLALTPRLDCRGENRPAG
jgi:hypothetical protein